MTVWTSLGAAALANAVRHRHVTATAVVRAHLEVLEHRNRSLNAVVCVDREGALETAAAVDAVLDAGGEVGPLAGVPFTVKDTLETRGLRTTAGAPQYANHIPDRDAVVVAQLKAAGAVLLGKTNTPPLAADVQTNGPVLGRANNPYDLRRTTGGSTGGGAAAVAAHLTALEVGSDHGGSLRIPAHCCGVRAFKPTEHALSLEGHLHGWPAGFHRQRDLVCVGFLARHVEDLALAWDVCSGEQPVPSVVTRPRLAVSNLAEVFPPCGHVVRELLVGSVARLAREAHVEVAMPDGWDWRVAWSAWGDLMAHDTYAPWVSAWRGFVAAFSGVRLPSVQPVVDAARQAQQRLRAGVDQLLERCDAWVLPVMGVEAFAHQPTGAPVNVDGASVEYWLATAAFTAPLSLTGHPVVVLPAGMTRQGLPVGLQLVGRRGGDSALLALAQRLEHALPPVHGPAV